MITNATEKELQLALDAIQPLFNNNIMFARFERVSKNRMAFTLKVKNSKEPGHRRGFTGRRMINACWHVHGELFDALFKINPGTWIKTGRRYINEDGGNWVDRNIGSIMNPLAFSDACDCTGNLSRRE